jgi:hypothetical protein
MRTKIAVPLTAVGCGVPRSLPGSRLSRSARLGEAVTAICKQGVSGSSPLSSTLIVPASTQFRGLSSASRSVVRARAVVGRDDWLGEIWEIISRGRSGMNGVDGSWWLALSAAGLL